MIMLSSSKDAPRRGECTFCSKASSASAKHIIAPQSVLTSVWKAFLPVLGTFGRKITSCLICLFTIQGGIWKDGMTFYRIRALCHVEEYTHHDVQRGGK